MIWWLVNKKSIEGGLREFLLLMGVLIYVVILTGCKKPQEYKEQADEDVYKIIDAKWEENIGKKSNYKVSDVEQDPNDIARSQYDDVSGKLSLTDAVAIATLNNRNYQNQKENLYRRALELTLVRHGYSARWFGTLDAGYENIRGDENVAAGGQMGFSKIFADGTRITSSIATDWINYLTGSSNASLASVLTGTISKPLLRGAGKDIAYESLTQSERDVLYEIRSFNRFRQEFVIDVISNYYQVIQNLDSVRNAENNYNNLVNSYNRAKMMAESGRLPPFEADQTEQNLLSAEDNLTRSRRVYQQSLDDFKLFMGISVESEITLDSDELDILLGQGIVLPEYEVDEAIRVAREMRLDLANRFDAVDDARRKVKVAENALLADVSLVATAQGDSRGRTDAASFNFNDDIYTAGVRVDLPFDRKAERNAYRRSLFTYQQRQREYAEFYDRVELSVLDAHRRAIESAKRFDIQQLSLKLAEARVESTTMLVSAGRAASRDLLDAQDSLLRAQNARTSAMVDYTIVKLVFLRDVGLLDVRADGMWDRKEYK